MPVLLPLTVRYHGVLRAYLCACQAALRVQFSACLTATVPNASEEPLSGSDTGPCSSGQRPSGSDTGSSASGFCVCLTVTQPLRLRRARGSVSWCHCHAPLSTARASHSDSHAPQDSTCPYVPVTQPHGPQTAVTATRLGPVCCVSSSHSHAPQTHVRARQPQAADPCMSAPRSDTAPRDSAQRVCLSVRATGPAASDKRVTQAHVPPSCPCHTPASGLRSPHSATAPPSLRGRCARVRGLRVCVCGDRVCVCVCAETARACVRLRVCERPCVWRPCAWRPCACGYARAAGGGGAAEAGGAAGPARQRAARGGRRRRR